MSGFEPSVVILDEAREWLSNGDDDDLNHLYCCDERRGLCGTDLTDATEYEFDHDSPGVCVVCRDLAFVACERCGE